jgi:Uma2 family endonuclease
MLLREPAIAYGKQQFTIGEYLEIEQAAAEKHEYYRGELFAMSGAKMPHNRIAANLIRLLGNKLEGKQCFAVGSDTRVHIEQNSLFTYPDVTVICGQEETLNNDGFNVLNPTVLAEVLSASTKAYDRNQKFELYRDIPSLRGYLMVDSETLSVEYWHLSENAKWEQTVYTNMGDIVLLSAIEVALPMADVYEGVNFVTT